MLWPFGATALVLGLVILVCVCVAFLMNKRTAQFAFSTNAVARIVNIEIAPNEFNEQVFYPVVEFDFNQNTYVVKSQVGFVEPPYQRGDNVTVWFEPEQPEFASLNRFKSKH